MLNTLYWDMVQCICTFCENVRSSTTWTPIGSSKTIDVLFYSISQWKIAYVNGLSLNKQTFTFNQLWIINTLFLLLTL
ncbi:hypothetical protein BLOT_006553 [Blomia tropicalis]|nr:hypothetical protein BLOT_006553 [Blomia tropicalis]